MADIDGGALSFKSELDNEQLNAAIEETIRRVQGFSTAVVESGDTMDKTTQGMIANARATLGQIGDLCEQQEQALGQLGKEYDRLGKEMNRALLSGRDDEYNALREQRNAIKGEITVRKQLMKELREQSDALEEEATKLEESAKTAEKAAEKHTMLRTQIRDLKEEMAAMVADGVDEQSAAYKELENELGRLMDIQGDIQSQGRILANDQAQFQGVISGLNGIVGGFTAAQGAVALFAGENENLQKIMLKVQSLMSIIMGLQQMSEMLNKDSAFRLVTLNKLKEWWNHLLDVGRKKQVEDTIATEKDTVAEKNNTAAKNSNTAAQKRNTKATGSNATAQNIQTGSAKAGTLANIGLAGAFRMVGAAIKSIPVFGWVVAGISALIAVVSHFVGKSREAKKAQEEWYQSIADNAYKPIAKVEELSEKWKALGDDMEAKKRFVKENANAFAELGASIKGVTDAENLLIRKKDAFIEAQIEKAKAVLYIQQAQDKVKELVVKEQEYNAIPDTRSVTRFDGYDRRGRPKLKFINVTNPEKEEARKELEAFKEEIKQGFTKAAETEKEAGKILEDAGIQTVKAYEDGTLGAIENLIQEKQEKLKEAGNNVEYEKTLDEISELQKQADAITGNGKKNTQMGNDPFLEQLSKRKAEYQRFLKWMNSGDAVLATSARTEFEGLLNEGATYIDYLKNQRDQILSVDVANRTKEQNKQLEQLNNAIAEETKQTVLDEFNSELNEQLANAQSTIEMLNIIEQKRKELTNDGTDLDNAKGASLDSAETKVNQQITDDTTALLEEYSSYAEQKRRIDEQYNRDYELLMKKRKEATTDAERAEVDAVLANLKKKHDKEVNSIGGIDYDAMIAEYGTFEKKKQSIIDQYEEKRKAAQAAGNVEMMEALDKAQAEDLSKLAFDELRANPDWELMFGDLDEISTRKLQELLDKINSLDGAYLGIEFSPKDLEALKDKIGKIKDEIQERNPFKALIASVKEYGEVVTKEEKKRALTKMLKSTDGIIELVSGTLDAVTSGMEKMGVKMDEQTQAIMGDFESILEGVDQIAKGIASGNPLSIIQGTIGLLTSVFDLFNFKDRKAARQVKKHEEAVKGLEKEYTRLSRAIDKALGSDVYQKQQEAIRNLQEQQEHLKAAWEAEDSRKKADDTKVQDFKNQYEELGNQIEDLYSEIANDILQTNAGDFASQLADSLVSAFEAGEDAAKAFESTVNQVLKNAIVNQLKKEFLDKQLQGALNDLQGAMGTWVGDKFVFDGLTDEEIASFKDKVQNASSNFQQAMDIYKDIFKDLNADDSANSLTGAVKGVSEETASILAGQMNAIRINQLESTEVLRQSLMTLNTIAQNTAYNRYLSRIETIITILETNSARDILRSRGLS